MVKLAPYQRDKVKSYLKTEDLSNLLKLYYGLVSCIRHTDASIVDRCYSALCHKMAGRMGKL